MMHMFAALYTIIFSSMIQLSTCHKQIQLLLGTLQSSRNDFMEVHQKIEVYGYHGCHGFMLYCEAGLWLISGKSWSKFLWWGRKDAAFCEGMWQSLVASIAKSSGYGLCACDFANFRTLANCLTAC
jgi:hypothetical protein